MQERKCKMRARQAAVMAHFAARQHAFAAQAGADEAPPSEAMAPIDASQPPLDPGTLVPDKQTIPNPKNIRIPGKGCFALSGSDRGYRNTDLNTTPVSKSTGPR